MGTHNGIENLSAEDQAWAKKIGRFGAWKKVLTQAVQENKTQRVNYLLKNYRLNRGFYRELVSDAVQHGAGGALQSLLAKRGFDFTESSSGDQFAVSSFMGTALEKRDLSVWKALSSYNAEQSSSGCVSICEPITRALSQQWHEAVRFELERATKDETSVFSKAIWGSARQSTDDLAFVLSWAHKFSNYGDAFSETLGLVVAEGSVDKTRLLLDKGADPNADAGRILFLAVAHGHRDVFELLLEKGGDLQTFGRDIETRLKQETPTAPLLPYLSEKLPAIEEQGAALAAKKQIAERYKLLAPDSYSDTLHLPDGGRLTTVFNFGARQQVTIAERMMPGQEQPVMAVTARDFDDIAGLDTIEQARQRLISLGGVAAEADMRGQINKPALTQSAAQHGSKPPKHP